MSGPTASDIITYVGVPFTVLGVLPILYNTASTLITLQNVKRHLRKSRLAGITRGDVINHVIEIELPRFIIAPLDREDKSGEYWKTFEAPSLVRGGSWTIFNWKMSRIGTQTYRLTYADQLRQPQAEVEFEDLLGYLMDLGAVPHAPGFRMLRTTGLWVPVGTPLLLSPNGQESALSIAPLDDSDGNLSLTVRWSRKWQMRPNSSLPPYWLRIKSPTEPLISTVSDVEPPYAHIDKSILVSKDRNQQADGDTLRAPAQVKDGLPPLKTMRCQIGTDGLIEARLEDTEETLSSPLPITHVQESQINSAWLWFASAATALGSTSHSIIWAYSIPDSILGFARQETVPCGVLVLLGLVPEASTPEWATQYDDAEADREAMFRKMRESSEATRREMSMTPEQKSIAVGERQRREAQEFFEEHNARRRRDMQRIEQRVVEAVGSIRWSNKLVSQYNLAWLKQKGLIFESDDLKGVVETLLYRMVTDKEFTHDITKMLDKWKAWTDIGGMKKADYLDLQQNQEIFAWASLVLAMIQDSVAATSGSLAMDLQESVKIWKRVRLG